MSTARAYLDHNATSPLRPEALQRLTEVLAAGGNPSSIHQEGRAARRFLEEARKDVGACLGAPSEAVTFLSGGTEANNLAISGCVRRQNIERIVVSAVEHPSVLETVQETGLPVHVVPVDRDGRIDLEQLRQVSTTKARTLVCIMLANNETGVIQPVDEVVAIAHENDWLVHTDAVQASGKMEISFSTLGADTMSVSAHKVGGPQGVGALVCRPGLELAPHMSGGGQEHKRRGGTENVPGIAAFAAALKAATEQLADFQQLALMRDRLESALRKMHPDVQVFGAASERLVNTSCFAVPGITAERALISLDLAGVSVSSGSACSSGKVAQSHVLQAMQVDEELARCAIRVSFGWNSAPDEAERFLEAWKNMVEQQSPSGVAAE